MPVPISAEDLDDLAPARRATVRAGRDNPIADAAFP
jgi:hypothetical protein